MELDLWLEPPTGVPRVPYIDNVHDKRSTKYFVLYDKIFQTKSTYGLLTDQVGDNIGPYARRFRCAVKIGRKVKYDDIESTAPITNDGWTYVWYVIPWAPLAQSDSEVGFISCYSNVYYTDS